MKPKPKPNKKMSLKEIQKIVNEAQEIVNEADFIQELLFGTLLPEQAKQEYIDTLVELYWYLFQSEKEQMFELCQQIKELIDREEATFLYLCVNSYWWEEGFREEIYMYKQEMDNTFRELFNN